MTRILRALKQLESREGAVASGVSTKPLQTTVVHEQVDAGAQVEVADSVLNESTDRAVAGGQDKLDIEIEPPAHEGRSMEELPRADRRRPTELEQKLQRMLEDADLSKPYRQLADRVVAGLPAGCFRSALVCRPHASKHGAEFVAHWGAALAASLDQPVLAIDVARDERSLTSQLKLDGERGFSDFMKERSSLHQVFVSTSIERLFVLTSGSGRKVDPAAAASRFSDLLQEARRSFRVVLVNGGSAFDPLAMALARLCDSCYLHVELGTTTVEEANEASRELTSAGARLLGCVATES